MKKFSLPSTLCKGETVGKGERFLGYLVGPLGFGFLSIMVNSYLNVYYTDVCGLGRLWGGSFMSVYPILVKGLDVLTYLAAGWLVDRTVTTQGKARPYLLLSGALLPVSALLLFLVPQGNDFLTAAAVLCSNLFFFAVVATLYCTANTLMVPLSSTDPRERSQLAVTVNAQGLLTGTTVAVVFPAVILPAIGVDQGRWITVMVCTAVVAVPLLALQYLFTRERVTEQEQAAGERRPKLSLARQLRCCAKSRPWLLLMAYFLLLGLVNALSSSAVFYYCSWVLGSYNDGITQVLFYAIGNLPMGIGVFLCNPLCKCLGRTRAMVGGLLLSCGGLGVCLVFPTSLPAVLAGQFIKAFGTLHVPGQCPSQRSPGRCPSQKRRPLRRLHLLPLQLHADHHKRRGGEPAQWGHGAVRLLGPCRRSHPHPAPGRAGVLHLLPAGRPLAGLSRLGRLALRHGEEPRLCQGGGEGGGVNGHVSFVR